ncbi:UDP-3-O-acyl-N-acetylglucosamine deacetylase [soil metagenome]
MRTIGHRFQRTLAKPVEVAGVGFITGTHVRVRFVPADNHHGLTLVRTDKANASVVKAHADLVSDTRRRTTLGHGPSSITLVEHVLAALAGLRIDNCRIEVNGPELPGLDGSAQGFVDALNTAGILTQSARRPVLSVTERITLARDGATIALHPADGMNLRASYILDYGNTSPLPRQSVSLSISPESFSREVANCRTFLLEHEAVALRSQGIGTHLSASEVLVFGPRGVIDNTLRFADEPARHKLLDLIGDLSLCGFDLAGHLVAYRSGHGLNNELARELARRAAAEAHDASPAVLPFRRVTRLAA